MADIHRKVTRRDRSSGFVLLAAMAAPLLVLLSGCATVGETETVKSLPRESRFVRSEIPIPGTTRTYPVWRTRSPGRPVLLLHPINGLSPEFLSFALELERWGYRAYLPSLYGDPIAGEPAYGYDKEFSSIRVIRKSGTWNPVSNESTGPIVDDAATMARCISRREGGRQIAVIGNSLTGNFPLSLLDEPCVRIAVLGQPALPARRVPAVIMRVPQSPVKRRALTLTNEKWEKVVAALRRDPGKRILGFHYWDDPMAPIERFDALHEKLGGAGLADRFDAWVMTPPGHPYAEERRGWVVGAETQEKRKMVTPHSTYTDAETAEDREWFRARLRSALARAW